MNARDTILARVRDALTDTTPTPPTPRRYRTTGTIDAAARVALFCQRVGEYNADVRRVSEPAAEIAAVCAGRTIIVPAGLPDPWRPEHYVEDTGLSPHQLDAIDGVVTGCTIAIAETGTIVLTAAPHEGRRVIGTAARVGGEHRRRQRRETGGERRDRIGVVAQRLGQSRARFGDFRRHEGRQNQAPLPSPSDSSATKS